MNILTINVNASMLNFTIWQNFSKQASKHKISVLLEAEISGFTKNQALLKIKTYANKEATNKQTLKIDPDNIYVSVTKQLYHNEIFNQYAIDAVISKIADGFDEYKEITLLHANTLKNLLKFDKLAPSSQRGSLKIAEYFMRHYPKNKHYACFDTSFHRTIPLINQTFAAPLQHDVAGIKYGGMHGLAYQYVSQRLRELDDKLTKKCVIIVYLDKESSVCGIKKGKSFAVSASLGKIESIFTSKEENAKFAMEYYTLQVATEISKVATLLGGIDGIVFSGNNGLTNPKIRTLIVDNLKWLGLSLNKKSNNRNKFRIHKDNSLIKILLIAANEELTMIDQLLSR